MTVSVCSSFLRSRRLSRSSSAMRWSRASFGRAFRPRFGEPLPDRTPASCCRRQALKFEPYRPSRRSNAPKFARLAALVRFPHDPALVGGAEPSPCRLVGYFQIRSIPIPTSRFASHSSRPTGSFRGWRFFVLLLCFEHQHRLSPFPPCCSLIYDQSGVSPILAQRALANTLNTHTASAKSTPGVYSDSNHLTVSLPGMVG